MGPTDQSVCHGLPNHADRFHVVSALPARAYGEHEQCQCYLHAVILLSTFLWFAYGREIYWEPVREVIKELRIME